MPVNTVKYDLYFSLFRGGESNTQIWLPKSHDFTNSSTPDYYIVFLTFEKRQPWPKKYDPTLGGIGG